MSTVTRRSGATLVLLVLLAAPLTLAAQIVPSTSETTLSFSPDTPAPGEAFVARVEAYSYDTSRASIRWSIDGVERAEFENRESIELVAPGLGEPLTVRVVATEVNGVAHTASRTIAPSVVELIVEGETRTPHFYRGRALPSEGSEVRLIALPSLYAPSGRRISSSNLVYSWTIDGRVEKRGVGADVLETTMPQRPLEVILSVESLDGTARHVSGERIEPTDPIVRFYEENPLYGLSRVALPTEFTLLAPELSVRAESYHTSRNLMANARTEWTLDGGVVENPNTDRALLTLRSTGGEGSARVGFSVRNLSALLQAATGSFVVYFTQ